MKSIGRIIRVSATLLFVNLLASMILGAAPAQVVETPISADSAFSTPDPDGQQPVIDAIGSARSTIQMWMYSMSNPAVVSALEKAASNGVKIEIIFDRGMFKGAAKVANELKAVDGITVYEATSKFSLTHAKTFVVDGSTAYIMSLNLTQNYPVQRDSAIVTQDASVVSDLKRLFTADIANSKDETKTTPEFESNALVVSPSNSLSKIVALIQSAQTSIDMTVENLGQKEVISALEERAQAGVKIRVITPLCDMNPNPGYNLPAMKAIDKAGISAKMMGYPATATQPYMHQKLVIVDGTRFFIGSENFSENSLANSREIGIIANLDAQTQLVQDHFDQDFGNAAAVPDETALKKCQSIEPEEATGE
jgi:cardiolipin synthase A/B